MTTRTLTLAASSLAVILSSCHPIRETPRNTNPPPMTAEEKAKLEAEEKLKEEEERRKQQEEALRNGTAKIEEDGTSLNGTGGTGTTTTPPSKPRRDYPFANKVPGKDGFVFSPYNNKEVDVRGIPSGTLVQDPTYPAAEKKYFRVP